MIIVILSSSVSSHFHCSKAHDLRPEPNVASEGLFFLKNKKIKNKNFNLLKEFTSID